ncbi:myeloid zinc finger 1-like isoform X1 [Astyanax mexicanus]|uniref:Myeloid zinc finger 1-like isoform X1 n=1 Tax=Astyanax mexicanus TaxID=7994 RepID=A0A8T2KMR2_ASTMX|nr:myeloid zinc finger 1-like isoform X1 [Astyanax mexicanus]
MSRIEHLSSFFIERLMSVAAEIYEAVKDTVSDYQREIELTKEENHRLRKLLEEISLSAREEPGDPDTDLQPSRPEPSPEKLDFYQRPLPSNSSVLQQKLELTSVKQEPESQQLPPNDVSASASPCAKSVHGEEFTCLSDTWTSHADGMLHEPQNASQGLQDTEPSLKQGKLELATMQEDPHPQQKHVGQSSSVSRKSLDVEGRKGDCLYRNPVLIIKLEPCDLKKPQSSKPSPNTAETCNPVLEPISTHVEMTNAAPAAVPSAEEAVSSSGVSDNPLITRVWSLNMHNTRTDKEDLYHIERPFLCESCGKRYKQKKHLKDHQRLHTGDRRFSCSVCGMRFFWTKQVKVHIQRHHKRQEATVLRMPYL